MDSLRVDSIYLPLQIVFIIFIVYVVVFIQWIYKMVDIISHHIFDSLNRFSPKDNAKTESLCSIASLKRFSRDNEYFRKSFFRKDTIQTTERHLFDVKENAPEVEASKKRPLMGLACFYCNPVSRDSFINKRSENYALENMFDKFAKNETKNIFKNTFSHILKIFALKNYKFPYVTKTVLKDERLKHAIEKTIMQQLKDANSNNDDDELYQELLIRNQQRAKNILYDMQSTISNYLLKFAFWVVLKLFPLFLNGVIIHPGQIKMLQDASQTNLPLIFLPLHRSHLDYIILMMLIIYNDLRPPLIASGDNLKIPFFGSLLRRLGAFYIKRRIDPIMGQKDYIYKAVLHTYINENLRVGNNIKFYLEGGRTRTGKPCMPKYGIFSVIVDAFMDGIMEDALLIPISINYEKLVDGNFVNEQIGKPKNKETFINTMKGIWHILNRDYGYIKIDINQPFSLREMVKSFNTNQQYPVNNIQKRQLKSNPSTSSLYGTDVVSEELKNLVERLSKHIIYDCTKATAVMSTNALAFLLLTKYRHGVNINELVIAFDELRRDLFYSNKDTGFSGDSIDIINYAAELLGSHLVCKEKNFIKPIIVLPNIIELNYYSNTLIAHYALDSIVALSINLNNNNGDVTYEHIIETVNDLCDIFQYEFLFSKPCQKLDHFAIGCIDDLNAKYQIFLIDEEENNLTRRSRRIAKIFDDNDDDYDAEPEKIYQLNITDEVVSQLNYLQKLLMPFIECYAISALILDRLVGRTLFENELIDDIIEEMQLKLDSDDLNYAECVSVDSIKNALKLFQKWDYLEIHQEKRLRLYYLKEQHDNSESIRTLYEKIEKYREK